MFTATMEYEMSKNNKLSAEVALSNTDINTFSDKDQGNNQGIATQVSLQNTFPIDTSKEKKTLLIHIVDYEFTNRNFVPIERYRSVEFARDWNINEVKNDPDNHIISTGLNLKRENIGNLQYTFTTFLNGDIYKGFKHSTNSVIQHKGYLLSIKGSYLTTEDTSVHTRFVRPNLEFAKTFHKLKGWTTGVGVEKKAIKKFLYILIRF